MKYLIVLLFSFLSMTVFSQEENDIQEGKKYYNSIAFGFNAGSAGEFGGLNGGLGFRTGAGYKWKKQLNFGGGLGFEFYDFDYPTVFIPIYAEARGEFTDWGVVPFYIVELGMGFRVPTQYTISQNKPKGVYFRPQAGWKFKGKNDFASTIGFGYLLQTGKEKNDYSWGEDVFLETRKRIYQRYFIQFGFEF